jgi:methionyl-tRNA formyltransferase
MALVDRIPIGADMTGGQLHDALARLGADLMGRALGALERGSLSLTSQPEQGVTYAAKLTNAETQIDWLKPAKTVHDHIRGMSPFPGAWFDLNGARVKVLRATLADGSGAPGTVLNDQLTIACGDGAVRLLHVQKAGKQPMNAEDFLRGNPVAKGKILT